ncbi:hypothetical protein [Pseudonocardia yuanmonensis]|uniref:hypothetical protein n=1 Tax=Pseudonocardia yuanmonensis TaxID=1095914 RepID=UPI0031E74CF1
MTSDTEHTVPTTDGQQRLEWSTRFARAVAEEIRAGVASGALTGAEADQLLARLRTVVEQALEPLPVG